MRTDSTRIRRGARLVSSAAAVALLAACGDEVSGPEATSGVLLTVTASQVSADQGRLHIEGATNRTVTLSPGDSREIDLPVGSYTVALEGLAGGTVVGYWERGNVSVTEGRQTPLTANLQPFTVSAPATVQEASSGQPFTVTWAPVTGAASYDLEASTSPDFNTLLSELSLEDTSASVTVTGEGTVFFRVRARTRFGGVGAFGDVSAGTVVQAAVARVDVSPATAEIEIGGSTTFTAVTLGPSDEVLTGREVVWSSSDEAVATVDASGRATGVAEGTVEIRATSEGVTGFAVLTVTDGGVATVVVSPSATTIPLAGPGTVTLSAEARSAGGTVLTGLPVTWTSDDESIATVSGSGSTALVTAAGGGTVDIVATIDGVPGRAAITVDAGPPPGINSYDVLFQPVISSCRDNGFGDFRTDETLTYTDNDGNMDPGRTFEEPVGGAPTGVESQWREEGAPDWKPFGYTKGWTPDGNATGSAGRLSANGSTCWAFDDAPNFMEFRVRVRDANGNWSPWTEKRLDMPAQVTVTPGDAGIVLLGVGQTQQFSAQAIDANGVPVPGDPINWSSYVQSPHATIDPTGFYAVSATSDGGLDYVTARAAYVSNSAPVQADFADGSWFSPGWTFPNIVLADEATLNFQVRVYAGRDYVITTAPDPNQSPSGDIDIYVRFGQPATFADNDGSSVNPGLDDSITFTAPADGVLWVLLHAFDPVAGALFNVSGDIVAPLETESLAAPGAEAVGSMRLLTDDEAARSEGMLLPPATDGGLRPPATVARGGGL